MAEIKRRVKETKYIDGLARRSAEDLAEIESLALRRDDQRVGDVITCLIRSSHFFDFAPRVLVA
jgi:hypothetical protein